jgi:hypothetical protein
VVELQGLDDVPWADLDHAFGSAADVPAIIQGLASPSLSEREEALEELRTTIWHQGTVYSATAPAVPFLVEVALADEIDRETRRWLVYLLAWIAGSEGRNALGHRTQLEHVAASREALLPRVPDFLAWLERESEPEVRIPLVELVAQFPERGEAISSALWRLQTEDDDGRRQLFYRLALLAVGEDEPFDVGELPDDYFDAEDREELAAALKAGDAGSEVVRRAVGELAGYAGAG